MTILLEKKASWQANALERASSRQTDLFSCIPRQAQRPALPPRPSQAAYVLALVRSMSWARLTASEAREDYLGNDSACSPPLAIRDDAHLGSERWCPDHFSSRMRATDPVLSVGEHASVGCNVIAHLVGELQASLKCAHEAYSGAAAERPR